ncbi:MAG: hypothetical protein C0501_08120 [Isosphaera sp.]|nr:hypothetical protein [Isosphaera sp.]
MPPDPPPANLIRVFDFYVTVMFLISFLRRYDVYWNAIRLLVAVRGRWPKLIGRLAEHKSLLLNWSFFRPAILALVVTVLQLVASRGVFPYAVLTGDQLRQEWWLVPIILLPMVPMLAVDIYFVVRVGRFDHGETVKYLDQAEGWLGWKGPVVRVLTLGIVNPKRIVDDEVRKSLAEMNTTLSSSLWWVIAQTGLRLAFGLTLWTIWAVHG